jgi:hypothetical protein
VDQQADLVMWRHALLILGSLLLAGCATGPRQETLIWDMRVEDWEIASTTEEPGRSAVHVFVPKGQASGQWSESLTAQSIAVTEGEGVTLHGAFDEMKAERTRGCETPPRWQVLFETPNAMVFEAVGGVCTAAPRAWQIGAVLLGNLNRFVIIYTSRLAPLPEAKRQEWIKRLSEAEIRGV